MNSLTLVIGNKNYSSWSLRAWLVMTQFEVQFQEIRIPLDDPSTSALVAQYSPNYRVPVLRIDTEAAGVPLQSWLQEARDETETIAEVGDITGAEL